MEYKIISGANDAYILSLMNFIEYHISIGIPIQNLIIYDLGLNKENLQKITNLINNDNFSIKKLDYNLYPEHVNLNIFNGLNCSYAFKPIIIFNESQNFNTIPILWLDCACKLNNIDNLYEVLNTINKEGFYCPVGNLENTIESIELNHPKTMSILGISRNQHIYELQSRLACIIGVNYGYFNGKTILDDWYKHSLVKDVIIPEGSSRNNHRQDQSILSALMFLYEKKYGLNFEKNRFNIICWTKHDNSSVENKYKRFSLYQKSDCQRLGWIYTETFEEANQTYVERKLLSQKEFDEIFYILQE